MNMMYSHGIRKIMNQKLFLHTLKNQLWIANTI